MKIMKKISLFIFALISMFAFTFGVSALDVSNEQEFIDALKSGGDIKLTDNIEVTKEIILDTKVTLDLNGKEVAFAENALIKIIGGNLSITGTGTLYEKVPYFSPIIVKGSENAKDTNYSTLTVGANVTLRGWAGIMIDQLSEKEKKRMAYGVTVNLYGTAIGVEDKTGDPGTGIYVNGNIIHNENAPVINIYKSAKISAASQGIYAAGFATWNIEDGASVEGTTGIEIRSGILNVNGGTIKGTAIPTETTPNGNGATTDGAGIAIVQHTTKNTIKVTVTKGLVEGYTAFYQNNTQKNDEASVAKIKLAINGGTFNAINGGKNAVYSENKTNFVTKGTFNAEIDKAYLAEKTTLEQSDNNYVVKPNVEVESAGVKFESDEPFSNEYTLVVTPKSEDETKAVTDKLTEAYKDNKKVEGLKLINLYEINIFDGNDEVVPMEDGKFTISIPLAEDLRNFKNYKVIYVNEDGEIQETIDAKLVNGKVVFTTTHLSTYGVIGYNNPTMNPETSDGVMTYAVILCASIFALGSAVTLRKRYN